MKCPQCHSDNPEGMLFCGKCGAKFASCPKCRFINSGGMSFCGKCGAKLSVEAPDAKPQSETKTQPLSKIQPHILQVENSSQKKLPPRARVGSPAATYPHPPAEKVKSHLPDSIILLGWNIFSVFRALSTDADIFIVPFCFFALTIPSIVFAGHAYYMVRQQDFVNAKKYALVANILNWIYFSIIIICDAIWIYTICY